MRLVSKSPALATILKHDLRPKHKVFMLRYCSCSCVQSSHSALNVNRFSAGKRIKRSEMSLLSRPHDHAMLSAIILIVSLLPSLFSSSQGQNVPRMTSDVKEVAGKSFDYIVVGGGTAGCPLAATLSEKFSVLLIERGGSPYGNPLLSDKKHFGSAFLGTDEFSSVAQSFVSKDGVANVRGRVLGGSSAINGGFYSRASADFIKRVGWDEELVKEAYKWVESKVASKPELTIWQSVIKSGLLEAGILPFNGFTWEHVEGTKIGGSTFDKYGIRHSSADLLTAGNPDKLTILLNATVTNVIFQSNGGESTVRGIRFIDSNSNTSKTYKVYLRQPKESSMRGDVVLCAGALGSPQILLLSGIGSRKHLNDFNIPVVLNLEGVGREMKDNPSIATAVTLPPKYVATDTPQVVGITKDFKYIIESTIRPITSNTTRIPIASKLAFPESKGRLELENTDPRKNPSVEFNYLKEGKDLNECVKMARLTDKIARTPSITSFILSQSSATTSPNELKDYCRKNVRTIYHFHGGCTVGSVVDSNYRVYGVKGLRVIDGSTFSESPGTNPMATLLMLGRYQGIRILGETSKASNLSENSHRFV